MRLEKGGASVTVLDHGDIYEIKDLEVPEGKSALPVMSKAAHATKGKDVWIMVDSLNEEAARLFITRGFEIAYIVMRRKKVQT